MPDEHPQPVNPVNADRQIGIASPCDIWHGRLNQIAHRASCVGWLLLVAALAVPTKVPQPLCLSLAVCCAIIAIVCSICAWLIIRPEEGSTREAGGAFIFSTLFAFASFIGAKVTKLDLTTYVLPWLRLEVGEREVNWALRLVLVGVILWIAITTALTRRGRE